MSGVMLNFKGKMYKLCEKKDMDIKTKSVSAPPKKAPKKAPKKVKKNIKVEGFPVFKGDEPKAKEEKRRDNNLY